MPKINISDRDLTRAFGSITTNYGVFVPGMPGVDAANPPYVAKEYRSLTAFVADVGKSPTTLNSNFTDMGYMYAAELLGAGLPVIYKCVPELNITLSTQVDSSLGESPNITITVDTSVANTQVLTTTALTKTPANSEFTFLDENGTAVPLLGTDLNFEISVDENKVLTLTETYTGTETASMVDLSTIKQIQYQYAGTDYVDPEDVTYETICNKILGDKSFFEEIKDRGLYDVSFVTTGGYPTIWGDPVTSGTTTARKNLISAMLNTTAARGDCFALIDFEETAQIRYNNSKYEIQKPDGTWSEITEINIDTVPQDAFIIHPWEQFTPNYSGVATSFFFPGSFAFLKCFAGSIRTNNPWFAIAGVKRGAVSCTGVSQVITTAQAESMQPTAGRSINDIIYIKPYGYTIYGNRTLVQNTDAGLVANSFINVRQLVHEIKRNVYTVCKGLMFDPNDDILWVNFKNAVTPLLEKMKSGQGITSYRLVKIQSNARGTMTAKIIISPIEAVETFDITIELTDEDIAVVG